MAEVIARAEVPLRAFAANQSGYPADEIGKIEQDAIGLGAVEGVVHLLEKGDATAIEGFRLGYIVPILGGKGKSYQQIKKCSPLNVGKVAGALANVRGHETSYAETQHVTGMNLNTVTYIILQLKSQGMLVAGNGSRLILPTGSRFDSQLNPVLPSVSFANQLALDEAWQSEALSVRQELATLDLEA